MNSLTHIEVLAQPLGHLLHRAEGRPALDRAQRQPVLPLQVLGESHDR